MLADVKSSDSFPGSGRTREGQVVMIWVHMGHLLPWDLLEGCKKEKQVVGCEGQA